MKDILIFGVPRSGKTTLAKMLIKELPDYHILNIDAIRNALADVFPELEINDQGGKNNFITLPQFMTKILYWEHRICRNQYGYIVEGCQILPEKAKEIFDLEKVTIIYLGHGMLTPEEILRNIRKYDTPKEYSYRRDDESLLKQCRKSYQLEKDIISKCKEYGFLYVDTSQNRKQVLEDLLNKIREDILKECNSKNKIV